MKIKSLKIASIMLASTAIIASCEKQNKTEDATQQVEYWKTIEDYPSEITLDNWEEFVYAPDHIIAHFQAMEAASVEKRKTEARPQIINTDERSPLFGLVEFYRGYGDADLGLIPFPGVTVEVCDIDSITVPVFIDAVANYLMPNDCDDESLCMSVKPSFDPEETYDFSAPWAGVTTLDIVLIQKHILGISPFTETAQFIAADVNRDGNITGADLVHIRKLILGIYDDWQNSANYVFLDSEDYDYLNDVIADEGILNTLLLLAFGLESPCLSSTSSVNRVGIKTGDVNGSLANYF